MTSQTILQMQDFFKEHCGTKGTVPDCRGKKCEWLKEACTHDKNPLELMLSEVDKSAAAINARRYKNGRF